LAVVIFFSSSVVSGSFHSEHLSVAVTVTLAIVYLLSITSTVIMNVNNASNIQKHMNAVQQEEQGFRKATAKADSERSTIEARLCELRGQQKELSKETRVASDAMGNFQKQRVHLSQQKERLQQQLKLERGELERCAKETKHLQEIEKKAKKIFCKQMEELNDELSDLLMQQEELRVQKMIGAPDSVKALNGLLAQKPETNTDAQKKMLETLVTAYKNYEKAFSESKALASTIKSLRARALAEAQRNGQQVRPFAVHRRIRHRLRLYRTRVLTNFFPFAAHAGIVQTVGSRLGGTGRRKHRAAAWRRSAPRANLLQRTAAGHDGIGTVD